jgi:hypothetical protein
MGAQTKEAALGRIEATLRAILEKLPAQTKPGVEPSDRRRR